MENVLALTGALGLITFTLVSVTLFVNFVMKGFYVYAFKASQDKDAREIDLLKLLAECEEQKVWVCLFWQRPLATLLAVTASALAVRFELGLSSTMGVGTVVFIAAAIALPYIVPAMPTFKFFSKAQAVPAVEA